MKSLALISNARKAQIIVLVNAILGLLIAFSIVLTQTQLAAIQIAVNAVLSLFVATAQPVMAKYSRKRPD